MSGVLVVAEHSRGILADITGELVGAALQLRGKVDGPVRVLITSSEPEIFADSVNWEGVDEIWLARIESEHFSAGASEEAALAAAMSSEPAVILVGHSASGMAIAPGLAVRLGSGYAADVFDMDVGSSGLNITRSGFGAKVNIELDFPGKTCVVLTVRGATFKPPFCKGNAKMVELEKKPFPHSRGYEHIEFVEAPASGVDISKAEFIMSVGRGIQDEKNLPRFVELAEKLGATLGCSRPIADSGWLHKAHQVGLTGKVAANCRVYVALGISGAVQHLHGMKHVDTIIAVNTDSNAPIFNVATYGATADIFEIASALEKHIQ